MMETEQLIISLRPPTAGEIEYYQRTTNECVVNPTQLALLQERIDALRLARAGISTGNEDIQKAALEKWNRTWPAGQDYECHTSAAALVADANADEDQSLDEDY